MNNKAIAILGAVLFVSLAINFFMAGLVAGGAFNGPHKPMITDTEKQDIRLRQSLSDADKAVLKDAMDVNRDKMTQLHADIEGIKKDMRAIVRRDTLDEKALSDALNAERAKELTILRLAHETRKEAMSKMSPDGRATLLKINRLGFDPNSQCH